MFRRLAALLLVLCATTHAWGVSSMSYSVVANGATVDSETIKFSGGASGWVKRSFGANNYSVIAEGGAYPGTAGAIAQATASVATQATVTAVSDSNFVLQAPGGSFAKVAGGRVVLAFSLAGDIAGTATIAGSANVRLLTYEGQTSGAWSGSLSNQPGPDSVAFEIALALPANLRPDDYVAVYPKLTLDIGAIVPGGTLQSATADAKDSFKLTGFRVLDAAGAQVAGFSMTPRGYVSELPPVPVGVAPAIEYYNASYGLYFVTSLPAEIADLDSGRTPGWQRTGQSFNVYTSQGAGTVAVCRFYGVFGAKSSHFYAPRGLGCEALLPTNPVWTYEGDVFYTFLPDASGGCPAGNVPVYRLYNNGQGGAPNHRFTTSAAIQVQMIGEGWVPEGTGTGVGMCSPQ